MADNSIDETSFWKKITLVLIFFTITPTALVTSIFALLTLTASKQPQKLPQAGFVNLIQNPKPGVQIYAAIPDTQPTVTGQVLGIDSRVDIVADFMAANSSPLEPYSEFIVKTADKYDLDFRLIPAIAQKESGLCRIIPQGSFNCWGWGIHSEGSLGFDSYEEGIETVSKGLRENYYDLGYDSVDKIMTKYAHPLSTTWAEGVLHYMGQME